MRYKLLGKSGLRVSELCLGTMTFGEEWGFGATFEESRKIFNHFADAGGNFLDTANMYTNGSSERFVGEFIAPDRDRWVLATKYTLNNQSKEVNLSGNHRKNMVQTVEGSLKRLKVDYIDLLWLHAWDFTTPVEEVMRAFDDLVRAGKILYIGVSDTPAWIVSQANTLAELRGWTSFVGLQIEYSLIERTPERDLIPMAEAFGMAITPWGPLAGGILSGKYNKTSNEDKGRFLREGSRKPSERELKIAETVLKIAKEIGKNPAQVSLNWLRQKSPSIIPILGAKKAAQLQDNLGCLEFSLSPQHIQELNDVSAIDLGFPHAFLKSKSVQEGPFSGTLYLIDNPH